MPNQIPGAAYRIAFVCNIVDVFGDVHNIPKKSLRTHESVLLNRIEVAQVRVEATLIILLAGPELSEVDRNF